VIETSNSQEPVVSTEPVAASAAETTQNEVTVETQAPETELAPKEMLKEPSLKEKILAKKTDTPAPPDDTARGEDGKFKAKETAVVPAAGDAAAPKYEPNFKYKAFGKEKEVDEFWKPLIKDAESEKKVKEVFTRADAFDDMKGRYETASVEHQKVLTQYTALDRDVRRVTKFLNSGDLDNFFSSLRVSDDMLLQHLQRKAEIAKLSPMQQQAYQQGIQARAENLIQQETMEELQSNYTNQRVQARTMQLDMVMMRPEVQTAASGWDQKMGLGAFRQLVIDEAVKHYYSTKQDLPAENAVALVLQKFGKLLEQPAPQAPVVQTPATAAAPAQAAPQAPQTTVVQGKPVIPNVNGRGTSPVKQAPKSLADLRKMAKAARMSESEGTVADTF
jgi:hypothetical protein